MATTLTVRTSDGIQWHCEQQGQGPDLILIPSGEGDCGNFTQVRDLLADTFRVTSFDMPGMSRSTAPEDALENVTAEKLAQQVVGLLDELSIDTATFFGCSSGGLVSLALVAGHPQRVRNAIVHEVPLSSRPSPLRSVPDAQVVEICRQIFAHDMVEDKEAWLAVGPEYHGRLDRNYVTWVRKYMGSVERTFSKEELGLRPIHWTVGALEPMGSYFTNVETACHAGIDITLLPCRHFPQVTIPESLAGHIKSATQRYL